MADVYVFELLRRQRAKCRKGHDQYSIFACKACTQTVTCVLECTRILTHPEFC